MTIRITDSELGWVAGILDGEGCIYVGPKHGLEVKVTNCDRRIVDRLRQLAGGRIDYPNGKIDKRSLNFTPWYSWNVGGAAAVALLELVLPLLTGKGDQARLAIQFGRTIGTPRARLSVEAKAERARIRSGLKELKRPRLVS